MKNIEVAEFFEAIADLLEVKGDNPFKIRAYRKAAQNIRSLTEDIETIAEEGRLEEIPGVGKDLAAKIVEIVKTGRLKHYEELKKKVPEGIIDLMAVPGIGPKTAKLLYDKLKIKGIEDLEKKAKAHKISGLPGLKEKTEENILRGIELVKKVLKRMSLQEALNLSGEIIAQLKKLPDVKRISPAGSLRRMKETVRDIDILITSTNPKKIMDAFVKFPIVKDILAHGETKASILTDNGVQVDVRVVEEDSYGAALVYFTGSQAHNIHMRHMAKKAGLKINEYGVFIEKTNKRIAGKEEADIYKTLSLPFIPPELREDRGEIEAALKGKLPQLVELSDIKGDIHVHSEWSDGEHSIEEMARACRKRGYEYVAITDHSKSLRVARGLSEKDVLKRLDEIMALNKTLRGIRILSGVEVDILEDGSLDYSEDILKRFDIVVAAIHTGFKQSKEKLTNRILKAIDSRFVNIVAHPTGRLRGSRPAYDLDFDKIFEAAKKTRTFLEINSYPDRLDLDDVNSRAAKESGVKLAIGTDAHVVDQLGSMLLGVSVARRAWLTKRDVVNTFRLEELLKFLRK
ncbi:MAG: DNA polymerase/3'-5' exonuclease PolX [Candidatus Omnitrophica bacterium]|nr:DNA polymerase/3'-5' exonuclease PolX [Candidatus Omnitrophota bacterium]